MSNLLSEEDMRLALFGPSVASPAEAPEKTAEKAPDPVVVPAPVAVAKPRPVAKSLSPKLRVTLEVTKEFEGDVEVFVHEANTLSTLIAEQEAKAAAKKKKFKYFEVVSIKPV